MKNEHKRKFYDKVKKVFEQLQTDFKEFDDGIND
jgi:hypothetical protein